MSNDKIKPGEHAAKTEEPQGKADKTEVLYQVGNVKKNDKPPTEEQTYAQPKLHRRLWRKFRNRPGPSRANWAEKSTVLITLVLAGIGALQARIYWLQKGIMSSSGGQTDQLICAAYIQADASKRNAQAAEDFAKAAKGINTQTETAVKQFQTIAKEFEIQKNTYYQIFGNGSIKMHGAQIYGLIVGKTPKARPLFRNVAQKGNSRNLAIMLKMGFRDSIPGVTTFREDQFRLADGSDTVGPGEERTRDWFADHATTAVELKKYQAKSSKFYIWGAFKYRDTLNVDENGPYRFCEWISADDARTVSENSTDGNSGGYGTQSGQLFHPCNEARDKLPLP
jgi:hypothetical protein